MNAVSVDKPPIQVALVEDDPEIRANLALRVGRSPGFRLLRSYSDAESALADLPRHPPDVVLMDINLPGIDGVECVRQLKAKMPAVQFIMLTIYEDGNRLFKSLMAGASGYLLKRTPPDKLLVAIREAHEGGCGGLQEVEDLADVGPPASLGRDQGRFPVPAPRGVAGAAGVSGQGERGVAAAA